MSDECDALHTQLQKSFDTAKQLCSNWSTCTVEMSTVLDSWSSLFEEYCCASTVDIETTPLHVHPDIDVLTKSKTKAHLSRVLDELQICHEQLKEIVSAVDKEWNTVLSMYKQSSRALPVECLCTATALRPSIAKQMAALEQLKRLLKVNYATKEFCLQRLYVEDCEQSRVNQLICVWKDNTDVDCGLQDVDLLRYS